MNTKIGGKNRWKGLVVVLAAIALTACGGGGGGDSPTAPGSTAGGSNPPPAAGTTPPPATGTTPPPVTETTPPPAAATPLAIASSSPAAGATGVALNAAPSVVFSTRVDPATIVSLTPTAFTVMDVTNGNNVGGFVELNADGTAATFTPRVNLVPDAEYSVTVSTDVKSIDGTSLTENSTWTFTAASAAVQSTYPASNATAAPVNTRVAAVFNTALAPMALPSFTLSEAAAGGAPVPGTVTYNNDATRTAVFTPTANLQPNTAYTATITTAATGQTSWTFTTGAQMDADKPTAAFSPANNAVNVSVNRAIKITFSEAIDPSTITGASFFVSDASQIHLSGHIVIDSANNTATFFPERAMAPGTPYHIVVTSGIKDFAGNALDTGANIELRSDFTTAAP